MTETQTEQGSTSIVPSTEGGGSHEEVSSAYLPDGTPMDSVRIVRATIKDPLTGQDREVTAAATDPSKVVTGAAGQALPAHEMGAAAVTRTLSPQPQQAPESQANLIERYLNSTVYHRYGPAIGRSPADMGLVGKGHVVIGHMLLMDTDTGEIHRVLPGTRIEEDKVYVNTRSLPEWLTENPRLARGGGT